jgi:uncharacterized protein YpbB
MNLYYLLILDVLKKVDGDRKISGIFYILTGKKTSQSLSDSQWLGMENYYASVQGMPYEKFYSLIKDLLDLDFIIEKEESVFILTGLGLQYHKEHKPQFLFLDKLNGLRFARLEQKSWQVISLFCQAVSNSLYGNNRYSPVAREREVTEKVRTLFPKTALEIKNKSHQLFEEITSLLSDSDEASAEIFVKKLSGYQRIGSTFEQISAEFDISKLETVLRFRAVLHQIFSRCSENPEQYPCFYELVGTYINVPALTHSASKTYQLLQNKTLTEIIKLRKIKSSTLEDHLVEIARAIPNFSIQPFISKEDSDKVARFYKEMNENKLRPIKDEFPHLSYLQIRLVLAKEGGKNATGISP